MSEAICKLIQKYQDKKYYELCLLSLFLFMWLVIAFTGFSELLSLFSNRHLGLIEAFLFTQIDLLSFQRSGIEVLPNNRWRSVTNDTFLNSYRYWYNLIYMALWLVAFRLLVSKKLNALILDINLQKALLSIKSLTINLMVAAKKAVSSVLRYVKLELKKLNEVKGIEYNPQKKKVDRFDDFIVNGQWKEKEQKDKELVRIVDDGAESNEPQHKDCPFCCEEVLYRAIKCKHCGSELEPIPEPKQVSANTTNADSKTNNDEITWKHFAGIGVVITLLYAFASGGSSTSSKISKENAKSLCRSYIAQQMGRPSSIIRTQHIKYDGGHFVKAYYYRPSDGDYFEYVCSLDNNTIVWAGIFDGNDIGRWRYEDEMKYRKNDKGRWYLY